MTMGPEPTMPLPAQPPPGQAAIPAQPLTTPTAHLPMVPETAGVPGLPQSPAAGPYPPNMIPAMRSPAATPQLGPPLSAPPHLGPPTSPIPPHQPSNRRSGWPGVVALVLVGLLLCVVVWQTVRLAQLDGELTDTRQQLAQAQQADGSRIGSAEDRVAALEKELGSAFNSERLAAATLPSVFRVKAGNFTGTAFAVGKPSADGGTNFFTNFHVVEQVWQAGGREVFLERDSKRYSATIVDVDRINDVAHLSATEKFTGLAVATVAAKQGQQVIVVGAPLGLTDTVTTGVISALREAEGELGPMIQFDAAINPGNSGGPVINAQKQVVGIATAKFRGAEGIGLAIPIDVACQKFKIC
jgi:hypothetical protein